MTLIDSTNERIHKKHLKQYAYTKEMGYVQKLDWLEMMNKRYDQVKCPVCGLYAIFKKKLTNNKRSE